MSGDTATSASYLAYQYGDAERLRVRYETHRLYSASPDNFRTWVIDHLDVRPGLGVLDVGCGPGTYHSGLLALGARVAACDFSAGMLEEALAARRRNRYDVALAQATAEALPFGDATFERVMANHMLYHVPDIPRALREMRRVARAGARIVLATNSGEKSRMFVLHEQAARDCGFTPVEMASARFTLDDLPLVQSVFPNARVFLKENAFVFPSAEPALRYYASYPVDEVAERRDDGSHREPLMRRMRELVDDVIAREGEFRSQKDAGCFVMECL
jgi:SAM-dependent methyltransferase